MYTTLKNFIMMKKVTYNEKEAGKLIRQGKFSINGMEVRQDCELNCGDVVIHTVRACGRKHKNQWVVGPYKE